MTAGSDEDLVETAVWKSVPARPFAVPAQVAAEPWPTGRHKRPAPPTLPAPAVPARPVMSHRRPLPPIDLHAPRPRVVDDVALLGFSRFSRGRVGTRIFTLFFVLVFAGILVQLVFSIVEPFTP